ncbi:MAG: hypothetical protein DRR04_00790 [Gammaproteobacteria bacterium]|nr:MAG: hypothetical protein DRR04_00790 [Gammaproteobacteria bacterium]
MATTLESHITDFIGESESRQLEIQQVFDATVSELSERLAALESELEEKEASLQEIAADRSSLAGLGLPTKLKNCKTELRTRAEPRGKR